VLQINSRRELSISRRYLLVILQSRSKLYVDVLQRIIADLQIVPRVIAALRVLKSSARRYVMESFEAHRSPATKSIIRNFSHLTRRAASIYCYASLACIHRRSYFPRHTPHVVHLLSCIHQRTHTYVHACMPRLC